MRKIIYELRLLLMVYLLRLALLVAPKQAEKTIAWFSKMPMEDV